MAVLHNVSNTVASYSTYSISPNRRNSTSPHIFRLVPHRLPSRFRGPSSVPQTSINFNLSTATVSCISPEYAFCRSNALVSSGFIGAIDSIYAESYTRRALSSRRMLNTAPRTLQLPNTSSPYLFMTLSNISRLMRNLRNPGGSTLTARKHRSHAPSMADTKVSTCARFPFDDSP